MDALSIAEKLLDGVRARLLCPPEPIPGGRNNRVFRVRSDLGTLLLKLYFQSPNDLRDRLHNEASFLEYLQAISCELVPKLYAREDQSKASLMEFVEGELVSNSTVGRDEVQQACTFFLQANDPAKRSIAKALPKAAEACFSLSEHLDVTQNRIDRLEQIKAGSPIEKEAFDFVWLELLPLWRRIRERIENSGLDMTAELPLEQRVLSPSDFGFHNCLRKPDGRFVFIDFEYAGWDDPAKLISDFQNQPDLLLTPDLAAQMATTIIEANPEPMQLRIRLALLEPLYQIKWACICLNPFLASGKQRLAFQRKGYDLLFTQQRQLEKARTMFARADSFLSQKIR